MTPNRIPLDVRSSAAKLAELVQYPVNGDVAKAFVATLSRRHPGVVDEMDAYCRAHGVDRGAQVRIRPAYLYSTVAAQISGGGVAPRNFPDLYAAAQGTPDPLLGNLDEVYTNQQQDGRQDSDQEFIALQHGFVIWVKANAETPDTDNFALMLSSFYNLIAASLQTGKEARQDWGPLGMMMQAIPVPFVAGDPTALVLQGISAFAGMPGHLGLPKLDPPLVLGAGMSFRVVLHVADGGIPNPSSFDSAVICIRHTFFGYTRTALLG